MADVSSTSSSGASQYGPSGWDSLRKENERQAEASQSQEESGKRKHGITSEQGVGGAQGPDGTQDSVDTTGTPVTGSGITPSTPFASSSGSDGGAPALPDVSVSSGSLTSSKDTVAPWLQDGKVFTLAEALNSMSDAARERLLNMGRAKVNASNAEINAQHQSAVEQKHVAEGEHKSSMIQLGASLAGMGVAGAVSFGGAALSFRPGQAGLSGTGMALTAMGQVSGTLVNNLGTAIDKNASFGGANQADKAKVAGKYEDTAAAIARTKGEALKEQKEDAARQADKSNEVQQSIMKTVNDSLLDVARK